MTPHYVRLRLYGTNWMIAIFLSSTWAILTLIPPKLSVAITVIKAFFFVMRVIQLVAWVKGVHFNSIFYHSSLLACTSLELAELILWVRILLRFKPKSYVYIDIFGSLVYNLGLCGIGLYFMITAECPQYMKDLMVVECAENIAKADAIPGTTTPRQIRRRLRRRRTPSRSADDALEMGTVPPTRGQPCPEFDESVLHWSQMSQDSLTGKGLWITTTNNERCREIAQTVSDLFSSTDSNCFSLVDVGQTCTLFSSLVRGLATASSEYRREIGTHPPFPFNEYFRCFPHDELKWSPERDKDEASFDYF
ncbi:hypothetical protein DFH08DRAFT_969912 [Mycena albidolilacea]|uniref:Uncharacterized protein n=1 Tax=Mycena albidolilacea TaxID=1033008 RepID=A0AAD6ZGZ9_9AGAR|nr:hypothetical protein DFH08DRAFT_969912 [Mycena albidolilacea]